jgi:hypothetical protein
MGNSRFDPQDWAQHSTKAATQTRAQIFTSTGMVDALDPKKITIRESVDSTANPASTPVVLSCDVTGSMGMLAERIVKHGLGVIGNELYQRKPITDPHIMCMATGDAFVDNYPLQVTQFEADYAALTKQIADIYLEGGGGGNGGESYHLAHWFIANKVVADAQRKRNRKGYVFTIGDEPPHAVLEGSQIDHFLGSGAEWGRNKDVTSEQLIAQLTPHWHVFHLIVNPGHYPQAITRWQALLGERAMTVADHEHLAEVIVSTIQVIEGHDPAQVVKSWSGDTSLVVASALKNLTTSGVPASGPVSL